MYQWAQTPRSQVEDIALTLSRHQRKARQKGVQCSAPNGKHSDANVEFAATLNDVLDMAKLSTYNSIEVFLQPLS